MTNAPFDACPHGRRNWQFEREIRRFSLPFQALSGKIAVPFRGSPPGDSFYGTESVELKANKLICPGVVFTLVGLRLRIFSAKKQRAINWR